jgi:uncharacterized membrane protein (GlpM family)
MDAQRLLTLYGVGSLGGALTVLAYWALAEGVNGLPFVSFKPGMEAFYAPMVWGGIWALLYILPLTINNTVKGLIFSLFPAFTHLALTSGGFGRFLDGISVNIVVNHKSLVVVLVYAVFWGLVTSYIAPSNGGGGK